MATGQTLMMQNAGDINGAMTRNREYTRQKHNLDKYGVPHPQGEVVEREKDQPTELPKVERKGDRTVRTRETGDKVYLITGNVVQWVKNLETLNALGWRLGQEAIISLEEFRKLDMGEPLILETMEEVGNKEKTFEEAKKEFSDFIDSRLEDKKPVLRYRKSV